ncbi:MAG TPA: 16S rRNA (uracil(1498)-N(3))-methyltransferase [Candidatus Onthovivens sp.]|nr:16S rRNA (uracil(1498)-N(3))-methyltransferase [Candidatus Onthovivens sp.]
MQRYVVNILDRDVILSNDDIFHIKKVMRMKINSNIEVIYEGKVYLCRIVSLEPFKVEIINIVEENHEIDGFIRLFYCLPKGGKLELVIQKAVEIGCNEIVLVNSERSIAKISNDNVDKKLLRFQKIIKEATEQSKREKQMILKDVIEFKDIKTYSADFSFIAYERSDFKEDTLSEVLNTIKGKRVNIMVGAEGGFSNKEVEYAVNNGYKQISLGKRILRSETACIYALSLLSFYMD